MRRRIVSLLLCLTLLLGVCAVTGSAAADADTRLEVVRVLGILVGDQNGNLNLDQSVTRAEFTKMMVAASSQKDSVTDGSGASLFTDVKTGHWAGGYISAAVENGWIVGYVDGSFRPDRTITLEEGCTALLRVLGYDAGALLGSYPAAQLTKAQSVGLRDELSGERGHVLSRRDCVTLFYNLLLSKNASGQTYGSTLGYTVTNGEIDYSALISADTKGPYIAESSSLHLPFGTENVTVYRNGKISDLSKVVANDVYYYHQNLRTVWVYHDRITGTLTAVSPNRVTPNSVTVSGVSYSLSTSAATYQFSAQGSFREGDMVTLLLGMDGTVVKTLFADENEQIYYGAVLSSAKSSSSETTGSASASVEVTTQIVCPDGTARTFYHDGMEFEVGTVVSAVVNGEGTSVTTLKNKKLSGSVNFLGTSFAGYAFAENVQILDTDGAGGYAVIYPQRLAGCALAEKNVLHYALNDENEIESLILYQVTGDTWDYAYLIEANVRSSSQSVSASYTYVSDGKTSTLSGNTQYPVNRGGVVMQYREGKLDRMYQLHSTELTYLTEQSAGGGNRSFRISEDVQVVLRDPVVLDSYYATTLSQIDTKNYTLTGWYDNLGCPAGGQLRVIVAEPK